MRRRFRRELWVLFLLAATRLAFGDGIVFSEVNYAKVQIPSQQALIHCSGGVERLVIETSFLGQGTNFAWIVPLPSAPEVKPVSENFFGNLRQAFQPELIHRINPSYAGVLFVCGLAFLGSRALKNEVSWLVDFPFCLLLGVGAGLIGKHPAFGFVAVGLAVLIRLFARSAATYALILLMGTSFAVVLIFVPNVHGPHLINTLGNSESDAVAKQMPGVTVVSVQHAGIFESTTIRGRTSKDIWSGWNVTVTRRLSPPNPPSGSTLNVDGSLWPAKHKFGKIAQRLPHFTRWRLCSRPKLRFTRPFLRLSRTVSV